MTEDNQKPGSSQLAELVVSAERHQQLQDIVGYVKHLHSFIDPDMYRLSLEKLEELEWSVEGVEFESEGFKECLGFTMQVSWEDLHVSGDRCGGGGYLFSRKQYRSAGLGHHRPGV